MLLKMLAAAWCVALLSSATTFAQAPASTPATGAVVAPSPAAPSSDAPARVPRARRSHAAAPTPSTDAAPTSASAAAPSAAPPSSRSAVPAALPAGTKVNLNTATAAQLDALPSVGKARLKAITDERAKGPFKDWDDFTRRMQHTSVNKGVQAKIKDYAVF